MAYSTPSGAVIRVGVDGADESVRQIASVGNSMNSLARTVQSAFSTLAGLVGIGGGLTGVIKMSDEYTKFTAQLRLATESQREYAAALSVVRSIANSSQQDLAATGVLYARISNGTRELGVSQLQVSKITEVVNLSLKVSGATATESASAMLQLSQSFASGTLRGEEFNAVNEAAPRLMKALADGIGVPVGALKKMAEEGAITSKIMADVLPNALAKLKEEAKQVQTIGGAFTVLSNGVMEFTALKAEANGMVSVLTGGLRILADNLVLVAGAVTTLAATKLTTSLAAWVVSTYSNVVASRALAAQSLATAVTIAESNAATAASKLAAARVDVAVAAAAANVANARVLELRASVLAASGAVALAIATNGLIPAEARAIALEEARAVALSAMAVASGAATAAAVVTTGAIVAQASATTFATRATVLLKGALAFLGGPIGIITTLLGLGVTAWMVWGNKGSEAEKQVTATLAEEIDEYIGNLNRQIDKLKERNELAGKKMISGAEPVSEGEKKREAILAEINRLSQDASMNMETKTQVMAVWGGKLNKVTEDLERFNAQQKKNSDFSRDARLAKWYGENGTAAQQLAAELAKLKKEFGEIPAAMEAAVRAKFVDKGAAAEGKAGLTANLDLLKEGIETDKALRSEGLAVVMELSRQGLASEAQVYQAKRAAALAAGADIARVKSAEIAELQRYQGKDAAERQAGVGKIKVLEAEKSEAMRAALASADQMRTAYEYDRAKPAREAEESAQKEVAAINQQIDAVERQISSYNKLPSAITAATITELEAQRATVGLFEGSGKAVAVIDEKIAAYKRLAESQKGLQVLDTGSDVTKAKELLDILAAVDNAAKSAADGMAASFGRVGEAVGGMTTALTGAAVQQQAIAAQLASSKFDAKGDPDKIKRAEVAATNASAQAKIKSYGDMAGAAKGFFKENTAGYKVLEGVEKAYRAFEMAGQLQKLATSLFVSGATATGVVAGQTVETGAVVAGEAARNVAKVPGVFMSFMSALGPWGAAAAAVAVAAVLGGAFSGGGGSVDTSKARQEKAGTGGVLGDESAKSQSIGRSIENLEQYASVELSHTRDMLSALVKIRDTIGVVAAMATQTAGLRATALDETKYGVGSSSGILGIGGSSTTIQDSGIKLNGSQTVGSAISSGVDATGYADILKKKSGLWGIGSSSKTSRDIIELNDDLKNQFGLLVGSMRDGAVEAVKVLGLSTDGILDKVNGMALGIDEISFKGLTGAEIEEQLQAVFSKVGDDIAKLAVPELAQFQKVGEGYLETLTRVATDYATIDSIMEASGRTFGAVGLASVEARERLIKMAGGLDQLITSSQSLNDNYLTEAEKLAPVQKYVTAELAAMGLQGVTTRNQFKDVVLGLDVTTEAGAKQYTSMLALADAFAMTHAATVDLTKSEQDIADERQDLQTRFNEATMEFTKLAELARAAISPYNVALYDSVLAAEAAKEAADALATVNDGYQKQIDQLVAASQGAAAVRALEIKGMAASTIALYDRAAALKAEAKAAADAKADATALGKALLTAASDAFNALNAAVNAQKKLLDTALKSSMAAMQLQIEKMSASITKLTSLSDALHSTLDSIRGQTGSAVDDRASAQAQVAAALAIAKAGGVLPDADSLKNSLATLSQDSSDQFSSYLDYQRDLYSTQNNLAALADLTDDQLSTEERALAMLETQKDLAQLTYDAEVLRLDGLIDTAKASFDVLNGINIGVASIPAALAAFANAIKAAMANPAASAGATAADAYTQYLGRPGSASEVDYWKGQAGNGVDVVGAIKGSDEAKIQSLYKSLLGRTGDAAGVDAWEAALSAGQSWDQIKAGFLSSAEYQQLHLPGFAGGGDHLGGFRVVGEDGPEIEATGPSRIFNAKQSASMLRGDNSELIAELRAQRKENAEMREMLESHLYAIARNTLDSAESLDGAVNGDIPFAVRHIEVSA